MGGGGWGGSTFRPPGEGGEAREMERERYVGVGRGGRRREGGGRKRGKKEEREEERE